MRELRKSRGWAAERLANEMRTVGIPWDRSIVANLEAGRRATLSVDEFIALAFVLDVAPVHLLIPTQPGTAYQVAPKGPTTVPEFARAWTRGQLPIDAVNARRYFSEVPDNEWAPPAWTPQAVEQHAEILAAVRAQGGSDGDR